MKNKTLFIYYFSLFFCLNLFSVGHVNAQEDQLESPHFRVLTDGVAADALPLLLTAVDVDIVGFVADIKVTQYYKNDGDVPLEAIYLFPGSTRGAVYAMSMQVGERRISGVVQKKQQARETYEQAVMEGKTSSLLEQNEFNFFQTRVGNILPGDDIQVELRYTETLIPDNGLYSFRFPLVRQAEEGSRRARDARVGIPVNTTNDIGFDVTVRVRAGMPIADIDSPSHPVDIDLQKHGAELRLRDEGFFAGDRDFVLNYRLAGDRVQSGLLLYQGQEENYFLLMAQPPARVSAADIPPREYLFVVDVSGSMNGYPLEIAKEIASELLLQLRPQDHFNVYLFASASTQYAGTAVPASREHVDGALAMLEYSEAGDGTALLPVLEKIAEQPATPGLSRSVIVVTDGGINVSYDTLHFVRGHLDDMNVFVFGAGNGRWLNHSIIEGLAKAGKGQSFIISERNKLNDKLAYDFLSYVAQPVLSDIQLQYPPEFQVYDVQPAAIPDVFSQRPVYVVGKWRGRPAGSLNLSGYSGETPYTASFPLHGAPAGEQNQVLRLLWAREQLSTWEDDEDIGHQQRAEEITQLGLDYNLLTPYTSFVAVDDVVRRAPDERLKRQALQRNNTLRQPEVLASSAWGFTPGLIAAAFHPAATQSAAERQSQLASVVQREQMPSPADPSRAEITFILGQDTDPDNPFYAAATAYFTARGDHRDHPVITHLRTLKQVKTWLQQHPPASGGWGIVNLVTHATPWTGVSRSLLGNGVADTAAAPATPLDLGRALLSNAGLSDQLLDRHSQIRLYGCGLGAVPSLLRQIGQYFGGADNNRPMVVAPRTPVVFQAAADGAYHVQNWPHWWVVSHGRRALSQAQLVSELHHRYGDDGIDWQTLLEQQPPAGVPRTLEQPLNVSVVIPDGQRVAGRIKASRLVYQQEELMHWLTEVDIAPGALRWSLRKQDGQWLLTGSGWLQQVMASPREAPAQQAVYTVVQ